MTATSGLSAQRESTGRTRNHSFIQTFSQQLGQFHIAIKVLLQCLKVCPNWNCLILKKIKPPFCLLTVVKPISNVDFTLSSLPQLFCQRELNHQTRDLSLSKKSSKLLASRLKEKNLLQPGTLIAFYRKRHREFLLYFTQENDIMYGNDVAGLLRQLGVRQHKPQDERFFMDSSKRSLKFFFFTTEIHMGHFILAIQQPSRKIRIKSNLF